MGKVRWLGVALCVTVIMLAASKATAKGRGEGPTPSSP